MLANYHSENCSTLQSQLDDMNQKVEQHADSVWSKVELLQSQQQNQPAAAAPSSVQSQSNTATTPTVLHTSPGDLVYRKRIFQDQLLYLTEALCLPDSGSVAGYWHDKSESDVCQAMKDMGRWQTSLEKLSTAFREYENLSIAAGTDSDFESDLDDFENIRIKVKEVSLAVKHEDQKRNL